MTAEGQAANTGSTTDDRTDIACWIGGDLMPDFGDALTAADRILASKWLAETIADAKAEALEEAAEWAEAVADRMGVGSYEHGPSGREIDLWQKYEHASEWLAGRAADMRAPDASGPADE